MKAALARTQRWLVEAISDGKAPARIAPVLAGSQVPARVGLGVYRHAYRARLVECLADDFSAVKSLLGDTAFETLAQAVIAAHPPRDATLNRYGRWMVRHLRTHPMAVPQSRPVLELARLEWALVEAIHSATAEGLTPAQLGEVPADAWDAVTLMPQPSLRVLPVRFAVNESYRQALRGVQVTAPAAGPGAIVVWRNRDGLQRHVLPPAEGRLLAALIRGTSLGEALDRCRLAPEQVQAALGMWIASGWFCGLRR